MEIDSYWSLLVGRLFREVVFVGRFTLFLNVSLTHADYRGNDKYTHSVLVMRNSSNSSTMWAIKSCAWNRINQTWSMRWTTVNLVSIYVSSKKIHVDPHTSPTQLSVQKMTLQYVTDSYIWPFLPRCIIIYIVKITSTFSNLVPELLDYDQISNIVCQTIDPWQNGSYTLHM